MPQKGFNKGNILRVQSIEHFWLSITKLGQRGNTKSVWASYCFYSKGLLQGLSDQ